MSLILFIDFKLRSLQVCGSDHYVMFNFAVRNLYGTGSHESLNVHEQNVKQKGRASSFSSIFGRSF